MYKYTTDFEDYNGVSRKATCLFNISQAELMEMQFTTPGGFRENLQRILDEKDQVKIMNRFKEIILMAYGELDDDGIHFKKSRELTDRFTQTPVYSDLYIKLATDEKLAGDFIKGILPKVNNGIPAPAVVK